MIPAKSKSHTPVKAAGLFPKTIPYLLLFFSTLFLYGGLLTGTQLQTHETPYLYMRTFEYHQEIARYGFPPALFPDVINRSGFAFPLFYPPASYLITTGLYTIIHSLVWSVHLSLFLSVLLSAWAMFHAGYMLWPRFIALPAALLYIAIPYRFVNVMVRGALAECWSFVWYPIVMAGILLIVRKKTFFGIPVLAIAMAGMILTHSITAIYFTAFIVPLALVFIFIYKAWKAPLAMGAAALLTVGLIAFYIFPMRAQWDLVHATNANNMKATAKDVIDHAPDISQLFFTNPSAWQNPSRGSTKQGTLNDGMSFELGLPVFLALVAFVVSQMAITRRRIFHWAIATWILFDILLLLILFLLKPGLILKVLPAQFSFIQFSWRILGPIAFFTTLLFGFSLDQVSIPRRLQNFGSGMAFFLIITSVNPLFRVAYYLPDPVKLEDINAIIAKGDKGFVELAEYLPRDLKESSLAVLKKGECKLEAQGQILAGDINFEPRVLELDIKTLGRIILPVPNYPVWQLKHSDRGELKLESHEGLLAANLPEGTYKIKLVRIPAPYQKPALWISLVSLLICVFLCLAGYFLRRRVNRTP